MDRRTSKKLADMGKQMPKKYREDALMKVDVWADEREKAEHALKNLKQGNHDFSNKRAKQMERLLEQNIEQMKGKKEVINEQKQKKIERYWDQRIKSEMRAGRLKPAKKDEFIKRMERETKRRIV